MKIKLLFSDYDGTLAASNSASYEKNIAAIHRFTESGGIFVLTTGRTFLSARGLCQSIGLKGYVVTAQGAAIYDIADEQPLFYAGIEYNRAAAILRALEKESVCLTHAYTKHEIFTVNENEKTYEYERLCGVKVTAVHMPLSEYVEKNKLTLEKVLCMMDATGVPSLRERLQPDFAQANCIAFSSMPIFLEVVDCRAGKGRAVAFLSEKLGIPIEQVACVGDGQNDLSMITATPNGFAVANAVPELKAAARVILPACDDAAVAYLIDRYCIGE